MQLAKILLPIHDQADIEPMARTAFALAARFDAEVEGLFPSIHPRDKFLVQDEAGAPFQLEALIKEAEKQAKEANERAESRFNKIAKSHPGVTAKFVAMEGVVANSVARRGRVSDLTVIGAIRKDEADMWLRVRDGAIFQTGRPVIVAPEADISEGIGKTVMIAWKDGVEAARAIAAAKPFIARADNVHIVSAGKSGSDEESLKEMKRYLAHYCANVTTAVIGKGKGNVAKLLIEEAAKHPDVLLVMGAYSQWRWREWAFGGVTDYMLRSASVPVLMAH